MVRILFCILLSFCFYESNGQDTLYWVGNSGYWIDASHWSTSSNGVGGAGTPDSNTTVIFNAFSFSGNDAIIIDASDTIPICKNANFSAIDDSVTIAFNSRVINNFYTIPVIRIYGSLSLSSKLKWDQQENIVEFKGIDSTNVLSNGISLATVSFNGEKQKIIRIKDVFKSQVISIHKGNLILEDHISCNLFDAKRSDTTKIFLLNKVLTAGEWISEIGQNNLTFITTTGKMICKSIKPGRFVTFPNVEIDCSIPASSLATCGISYFNESLANRNKDVSFQKLRLLSPSTIKIMGSIEVIDSFVLNENVQLQINNNDTLYTPIFKMNNTTSSCISSFSLTSDQPGSRAFLNNTGNDTLAINGALVKDMKGIGLIKVLNGRDNGNNESIVFDTIPEPTKTYFWIGGNGSINDTLHWSLSSNGPYAGCLPSYNDNIVFNAFSFQNTCSTICPELTIPIGIHSYKSIVFNNIASLKINILPNIPSTTIIEVAGSLILDPDVTIFLGQGNFSWSFTGTNESFINSNGVDMINVEFNGTAQYRLLNDLKAMTTNINLGRINVSSGKFNTNGYNVLCRNFVVNEESEKELLLNNDTITCDGINFNANVDIDDTDYTIIAKNFINSIISADKVYTFNRVILKENFILNIKALSMRNRSVIRYLTLDNAQITSTEGEFNVENVLTFTKNQGGISFNNYPFLSSGLDTFNLNCEIIIPASSCNGNYTIRAEDTGETKYIKSNKDTIIFSNMLIMDLTPISPATVFIANNSIVSGPISSWILTNTAIQSTYYWVGGNGTWNDIGHWSLSSGGLSATCMPGIHDKVVFDNNSNTGVNSVQVEIPLFYEFSISDLFLLNTNKNVSIVGLNQYGNTNINITDTLLFNEKFATSRIHLSLTGNLNSYLINSTLTAVYSVSVNINKYNATVQLDRNYLAKGGIYLYSGTLKTNNYRVEVSSFYTSSGNNKTFDLGTSQIYSSSFGLNNSLINILNSNYTFFASNSFSGYQNNIYNRVVCTNSSEMDLNFGSLKFDALYLEGLGEVDMLSGPYYVYDSLVIGPGAKLSVHPSASLVIEGVFVSGGVVGNLSFLKSDVVGTTFNLSSIKNQCLQYINIKDCRNIGGASINAQNSTNGGNNTNINFTTPVDANKLYWIKGSGNWNQMENWSFGSGSCPATRIPTAADDVIFDDYSTLPSIDV
nr:hypothetical protein [Saprospiraceae bacterium]